MCCFFRAGPDGIFGGGAGRGLSQPPLPVFFPPAKCPKAAGLPPALERPLRPSCGRPILQQLDVELSLMRCLSSAFYRYGDP